MFGIEQMKKDSLYGPPKEMFNTKPKLKEIRKRRRNRGKDKNLPSEDEFSADEFVLNEMDDGH